VIDQGKALVEGGTLLDFTVFNVQPWLDIGDIGSTVIAVAEDEESAKKCAEELAEQLFANRDGYWPELLTVDEIIDRAESEHARKPVILVDASDSPNGGAPGDSAIVAMRLLERGSSLKAGMFVKDPEAAKKAFEVGVGNKAYFEVGNKFTPDIPAPLKGEAVVRSLHDGDFLQEGPAGKGLHCNVGLSAVLSFGFVDIMVCEQPGASGDPQILRHFGIEPKVYDLIVVKANTSFRVPYSAFASVMCNADTPGAGTSNLKRLVWRKLPKNFYPFDLAEDYVPAPATIRRG
jgi:microcystin degradation protein MlrC